MSVAALVDTSVLVYRVDPRDARKQELATSLLRAGLAAGTLRLAHQAVVEFMAAVTRPLGREPPLLEPHDAHREAEELLGQFEVLYPDAALVRLALRGRLAYRLPWWDAHMWAYAERFGLSELISEDFEPNRLYGAVRVVDPFHEENVGS